jgi:hypothetical protein
LDTRDDEERREEEEEIEVVVDLMRLRTQER